VYKLLGGLLSQTQAKSSIAKFLRYGTEWHPFVNRGFCVALRDCGSNFQKLWLPPAADLPMRIPKIEPKENLAKYCSLWQVSPWWSKFQQEF